MNSRSLQPGEEITLSKHDHSPIRIRKSQDGVYQMWSYVYIGMGWIDLPQSVESIEKQIWEYSQNDH